MERPIYSSFHKPRPPDQFPGAFFYARKETTMITLRTAAAVKNTLDLLADNQLRTYRRTRQNHPRKSRPARM
jgi:hypothetical protein